MPNVDIENDTPRESPEEQRWWEDSMIERFSRGGWKVPDNARETVTAACKLYRNQAFHPMAIGMALAHPYGLQMLSQAPVLAQAANRGAGLRPSQLGCYPTAVYLGGQFGKLVDRGDKLAVLLRRYDMPLAFRALSGFGLSPKRWLPIWYLRNANPSTLAQVIPANKSRQNNWLYLLSAWQSHVARRTNQQRASLCLEWAAKALAPIAAYKLEFTTVADFAIERAERWHDAWTWDEANAAALKWHEALGKQKNEKTFFDKHGIGWSDPIEYAPFPLRLEVDGFEFVALNSGAELYLEGVAMHHCVGIYSADVISGRSRVFSIRKGGKRIATVGARRVAPDPAMRPGLNLWRCSQLKGPCNRPVEAATMNAATNWMREAMGMGRAPDVKGMDVEGIRAAIQRAGRPEPREE